MTRSLRVLALTGCLGMVAISCGGSSDSSVDAAGPPEASETTSETVEQCSEAHYNIGPPGSINASANSGTAYVTGTLTKLGMPQRTLHEGTEFLYGEAEVTVEEVILDSPKLKPKPGEVISVHLMATHTCGIDGYRETQGDISEGMRLLAGIAPIQWGPERKSVNDLAGIATWKIEAGADGQDQAVNMMTSARTAPLERVKSVLREERQRGRDPSRDRGPERERPFD